MGYAIQRKRVTITKRKVGSTNGTKKRRIKKVRKS